MTPTKRKAANLEEKSVSKKKSVSKTRKLSSILNLADVLNILFNVTCSSAGTYIEKKREIEQELDNIQNLKTLKKRTTKLQSKKNESEAAETKPNVTDGAGWQNQKCDVSGKPISLNEWFPSELLNWIRIFDAVIQERNISLSFSWEQMKYYLATWHGFIDVDFFKKERQSSTETNRRDRKKTNVHAALLNAYATSFSMFEELVNKTSPSELLVFTKIGQLNFRIPKTIYLASMGIELPSFMQYTRNLSDVCVSDVNWVTIPLEKNGTPVFLIVLADSYLIQTEIGKFIVPSETDERLFRPIINVFFNQVECLKNSPAIIELWVTETGASFIDWHHETVQNLNYEQRLSFLERAEIFKIPISTQANDDGGYVKKSKLNNDRISFRKEISKPIAAIVGMSNKQYAVCFKTHDDILHVIGYYPAPQEWSFFLRTRPFQGALDQDLDLDKKNSCSHINLNGKPITITGLEDNARLFPDCILAEIDPNKKNIFRILSEHYEVSWVSKDDARKTSPANTVSRILDLPLTIKDADKKELAKILSAMAPDVAGDVASVLERSVNSKKSEISPFH